MDKNKKLLTNLKKYKVPLRTFRNVFSLNSPFKKEKLPFNPLFAFNIFYPRRASRHVSPFSKGSMTLEAAIILPFFLMTILAFLSFIEIIQLQNGITMALRDSGMTMGVYGYAYDYIQNGGKADLTGVVPNIALSYGYVGAHVKEFLGEEYPDNIMKPFGSGSIHYYNSSFMEENDVIDLVATYAAMPRFNIVALPRINLVSRYYGRAWTGYELDGKGTDIQSEENVYITKDGNVYHLSRYCTHLQLTITSCLVGDIHTKRNDSGELYRACLLCGIQENCGKYYITPEGDCFHNDPNCSGLKRTIDVVPLSEVNGRAICSRCGG